jgi:hypothetical protein
MTSVVIAFADLKSRAIISTPDELRTGPAFSASTRIPVVVCRAARRDLEHRDRTCRIEQLEIGKIRMPIMVVSESEGNTPFWTEMAS